MASPQRTRVYLYSRQEARVKIETSKNEAGDRLYRIAK